MHSPPSLCVDLCVEQWPVPNAASRRETPPLPPKQEQRQQETAEARSTLSITIEPSEQISRPAHQHTDRKKMENTNPNQTFGIELEFLCLRPQHIPSNPSLLHSPIYTDDPATISHALYAAMTARGVPTGSLDFDNDDMFVSREASFTKWCIESDTLVLSAEEAKLLPPGWKAESVEVGSRKLFYNLQDWKAEIAAVLQALRDVEQVVGVRFITNASTGFHVHVGYSNEIVSLRTAKSIFQLATGFEHLIDEMHAVSRVAIPWDQKERHHCFPPSFFHIMKAGHRNHTVLRRMIEIEKVRMYQHLGAFFSLEKEETGFDDFTTGHNSAYNFDNLFPDPGLDRHMETLLGTVEFRQHVGTLDFLTIAAWVEFCVGTMRFAAEADLDKKLQVLARCVDDRFGLQDLLAAIGVEEGCRKHYQQGGEDESLGVLPSHANNLPSIVNPLTALLEQNDDESTSRSEKGTVAAAIEHKYLDMTYGHDPKSYALQLSFEEANEIVGNEAGAMIAADMDLWCDEGKSNLKQSVLMRFDKLYEEAGSMKEEELEWKDGMELMEEWASAKERGIEMY